MRQLASGEALHGNDNYTPAYTAPVVRGWHVLVPYLYPSVGPFPHRVGNEPRPIWMPNSAPTHRHGRNPPHHHMKGRDRATAPSHIYVVLHCKNMDKRNDTCIADLGDNYALVSRAYDPKRCALLETWIDWQIPDRTTEVPEIGKCFPPTTLPPTTLTWWDIRTADHNLEIRGTTKTHKYEWTKLMQEGENCPVGIIFEDCTKHPIYFRCGIADHQARGHQLLISVKAAC